MTEYLTLVTVTFVLYGVRCVWKGVNGDDTK